MTTQVPVDNPRSTPTIARAWQVTSAADSPFDSVRLQEVPLPAVGTGEARVAVRAAAIGFPDMLLSIGKYHDRPAMPFTLGGEAAGHVVEVGEGVDIEVGTPVIVAPAQVAMGLLADQLVVPAERLLPIPSGMSMTEAAAFTSAYQTSYMGLVRRCHLSADETLLVLGASGGIGSAAIEIGRALGARVIAVTRGEAKVAFCADLGADHVIDLAVDDDLVGQVKSLTAGAGANVVFDPVGGDQTDAARRCVTLEGRLLIIGFASGKIPQVPVNHALLKNYSIVGFRTWPFRGDPAYRAEVHSALSEHFVRGELRPRVEEIDFADVPTGLQRLADRRVAGRLVATIGDAR